MLSAFLIIIVRLNKFLHPVEIFLRLYTTEGLQLKINFSMFKHSRLILSDYGLSDKVNKLLIKLQVVYRCHILADKLQSL